MGALGNRTWSVACLAMLPFVLPAVTFAQDTTAEPQQQEQRAALAVPALFPVEVVLDEDLGSKISTTGQTFPLHLAEAIVIDGKEIVAAGAPGEGEVIHAKKAGGSGAPGELVLTARHLIVDGRVLKLRSLKIGGVGGDAVNGVVAFNAATAVTPLPIGIIGFAVTGRNIVYPKGTLASAKTAAVFEFGQTSDDLSPKPIEVEDASSKRAGTEVGSTQ